LRVLTQLIIKFLMVGIITVLVLPAVAAVTFGQALWAALIVTLIAYVLGDVGVLPRGGNAAAVFVDFVLATLIFWALPMVMPVAIGFGPARVTGGAVAVGEILFHMYLNASRPRQAGG
jgi:hypothetical protein